MTKTYLKNYEVEKWPFCILSLLTTFLTCKFGQWQGLQDYILKYNLKIYMFSPWKVTSHTDVCNTFVCHYRTHTYCTCNNCLQQVLKSLTCTYLSYYICLLCSYYTQNWTSFYWVSKVLLCHGDLVLILRHDMEIFIFENIL